MQTTQTTRSGDQPGIIQWHQVLHDHNQEGMPMTVSGMPTLFTHLADNDAGHIVHIYAAACY